MFIYFDSNILLSQFQFASDYLSPQLKNSDGLLRLHAYWSHLELNLGKDLVAARGVWESLLKIRFDNILLLGTVFPFPTKSFLFRFL